MGHNINLADPVELTDDGRLLLNIRQLTETVNQLHRRVVCDCGLSRMRVVYNDARLWAADHHPTCAMMKGTNYAG